MCLRKLLVCPTELLEALSLFADVHIPGTVQNYGEPSGIFKITVLNKLALHRYLSEVIV